MNPALLLYNPLRHQVRKYIPHFKTILNISYIFATILDKQVAGSDGSRSAISD
jgi:hypothetical protein